MDTCIHGLIVVACCTYVQDSFRIESILKMQEKMYLTLRQFSENTFLDKNTFLFTCTLLKLGILYSTNCNGSYQ